MKPTLGSISIAAAMVLGLCGGIWLSGQTPSDGSRSSVQSEFERSCASCHGEGARGGDRAPALMNNRGLRSRSEVQIHDLIRDGTRGGMPAFPLPEATLNGLAKWIRSLNIPAAEANASGDSDAGARFFFGKGGCASCHMVRGRGKANGPDLSSVGQQLSVEELHLALDDPARVGAARSSAACPSWAWCPQNPWAVSNVRLRNGSTLRGFVRSQGLRDLQLQTLDGRFVFLHQGEYDQVQPESESYMPRLKATADERRDLIAYLSSLARVPAGALEREEEPIPTVALRQILTPARGDWVSYNGTHSGNRHSSLEMIHAQNVGALQMRWSYSMQFPGLQTTPVVVDGVMYVSGPNQACAIDASTGRQIWCYSYSGDAARESAGRGGAGGRGGGLLAIPSGGGVNRGVAVLHDRVFLTTDNAHLLCLNRFSGGLMWDVAMPTLSGRYSGPGAPLVVNDLVIAGHAGGDGPLRGFIAAYKATTGQEVWRFWTIPNRGEPGSETWKGTALETGGGATWLTGSYDPEAGLVYWPTGNPYPPTDGDQRQGDNLYTDAVVALDGQTGKLKWHYQFTPHDLHDYDATEPLVLVDAQFRGRPRKLLLQANRNGFFYVLDRLTGEFLLGAPFVKKLTWATGIGTDGRPQVSETSNKPTPGGTVACPAVRGATNWYSTAYNPISNLFYVMAVEDCNIYRQGRGGYVPIQDPANPPEKYLRAIDIRTAKTVWEVKQVGVPEANYSGVLSTAGGLVFYGETGGGFAAVDAKTGKTLWHFETGALWKASPMTYMAHGQQFVAIASGNQILSFGLPR